MISSRAQNSRKELNLAWLAPQAVLGLGIPEESQGATEGPVGSWKGGLTGGKSRPESPF